MTDLILLADHRLAVALAYGNSMNVVEEHFPGTLYASNRTKTLAAILALVDTDPLAEVQGLKRLAAAGNLIALEMRDVEAEAIDLRAEVRELKSEIMDLKFELNWVKDKYDV